ncbi:MAG: sigma-70 family RNA polymerase sigma factor [Oscillospiraceae bacterium]|nr:sigma-70 family RNA polymerase sigma factor [Oscillospiraceae bacterium]
MFYKGNKVEFVKVGENANRVKLSSIYDNNCSSQEYVIVDDEMLEYLIKSEQQFNASRRTMDNHVIALPEDETAAAKMGVMDTSAEEKYFSEFDKEQIHQIQLILSELSEKQRKRLYMRFHLNMSYTKIARIEGSTIVTVRESCERTIKRLKKYSDFLQDCTIKSWVNLLI